MRKGECAVIHIPLAVASSSEKLAEKLCSAAMGTHYALGAQLTVPTMLVRMRTFWRSMGSGPEGESHTNTCTRFSRHSWCARKL